MITPEFHYERKSVPDPIKDRSYVDRVTFQIPDINGKHIDRSYFIKKPGRRSGDYGSLEYEKAGYDLLTRFGVSVPKYQLMEDKDGPVFVTNMANGINLHACHDIQVFLAGMRLAFSQHLTMWNQSSIIFDKDPDMFSCVRRTDPILEALETAQRLNPIITDQTCSPAFVQRYAQVLHDLEIYAHQTNHTVRFLQHGEEVPAHLFYDQGADQISAIDCTPKLSTRMERALNRSLVGFLNFTYGEDFGEHPLQTEKVKALLSVTKEYAKKVEALNSELCITPTNVLRELVFINLTRVACGIVNPENKLYFQTRDTRIFTEIAYALYDELS